MVICLIIINNNNNKIQLYKNYNNNFKYISILNNLIIVIFVIGFPLTKITWQTN